MLVPNPNLIIFMKVCWVIKCTLPNVRTENNTSFKVMLLSSFSGHSLTWAHTHMHTHTPVAYMMFTPWPNSRHKEHMESDLHSRRVRWLTLCGVLWKYNWCTSNASKGLWEVQIPLPLICLCVVHLNDACDVVQMPVVASDDVDLPVQ